MRLTSEEIKQGLIDRAREYHRDRALSVDPGAIKVLLQDDFMDDFGYAADIQDYINLIDRLSHNPISGLEETRRMKITKRQLKRIIRESLLTEAVPGTLGKWISTDKQSWLPADDKAGRKEGKNEWVTEWWLPVRGEYGGLVIGSIQYFVPGMYSREDAKPGWRWRIHDKDWKGFQVGKHDKLIKKDNRNAYPKGEFIQNYDPDFGESMKGEVEAAVIKAGGIMKGDVDTSKPPPSAAALVQGTKDIPGVKVGETSADGVSVSYELEGVTGAGARAQLKKLLQPLGFSGFNPGRYMGGGMAFGYGGGGPQKTISAAFDQGGKIFAEFSTSTTFGEKTTRVSVEAEWSREEKGNS